VELGVGDVPHPYPHWDGGVSSRLVGVGKMKLSEKLQLGFDTALSHGPIILPWKVKFTDGGYSFSRGTRSFWIKKEELKAIVQLTGDSGVTTIITFLSFLYFN
jgi:hypothetical protein